METWYKVATPRKEVREGSSFYPKGSEDKRLRDAILLAVPGWRGRTWLNPLTHSS